MLTPRRLAANGLNALRSIGPRTEEGKARSSLNSLTHGFESREGEPEPKADLPGLARQGDNTAFGRAFLQDAREANAFVKLGRCGSQIELPDL